MAASPVAVTAASKGIDRRANVYIIVGLGESISSADYFALEVGAAVRLRDLLGQALTDPVPKWGESEE